MPLFLASDNISGAHPAILNGLIEHNVGYSTPYGSDAISRRAKELLSSLIGLPVDRADIAFVFNGTGANVLGLSVAVSRSDAIIASDSSHIWIDEAGAVEHFSGCRIIPVPTFGKKLTLADIDQALVRFPLHGTIHRVIPKVVSISQPTEFGLVYTPEEIRALSDHTHDLGMLLHVDGSRLSNAAAVCGSFEAALGGPGCGCLVDILSWGATKNGAIYGEAVLFMGRAKGLYSIQQQKQALNLASKQRYIASQFLTLFGTDLWLQNAARANSAAKKLEALLLRYAGPRVHFHMPVETNALFISLPERQTEQFLKECSCYVWDSKLRALRIMTSWATTDEEILEFESIAARLFSA